MDHRKLILIFTRDFSLWINQLIRDQMVFSFPDIWGAGLEDQIVYFNGRTTELYRYEDDYKKLSNFMSEQVPLNHYIFQEETHEKFRTGVQKFRELIKTPIEKIDDPHTFLYEILQLQKSLYPFYTLSVFVPGAWREDFIKNHGEDSQRVFDILSESRRQSEGVYKLFDIFLRNWIGQHLLQFSYPSEWIKLLSIEEILSMTKDGTIPPKEDIEKRSHGYIFIDGKINTIDDFNAYLLTQGLKRDNEDTSVCICKGTVACRGGKIHGNVKTLMNSTEVSNFTGDNLILVTPMTSPEYLPAMKKSLAIVTDEGGLTCHAAIIARELNIPCVIGTKNATRIFKDGDVVEVDANNGIIKKIVN